MKTKQVASAALLCTALLALQAKASTFDFSLLGPGVSANIEVTYGTTTDARQPSGYEITGVSGTFSDINNSLNIVNVPVGALVPIRHDSPEPTNLLAPADFSRFNVGSTTGLPAENNGGLTYDNLYYPGGSPATATDYPLHGGFLDIYGLMFQIGGGRVVDIWSNGTPTGLGNITYGVAVAMPGQALDYVGDGVSTTPEPGALSLLGIGLLGLTGWRRISRSRLPRQN